MRAVTIAVAVLVVILMLVLTACGQGQITSSLGLVLSALQFAVPVIGPQLGLPPVVLNIVITYLSAVNQGSAEAAVILADATLAPAVKAAKVVQLFSSIAAPNLPPGTPQVVVDVIDKVSGAVAKFLINFQGSDGKLKALPPGTKLKISAKDLRTLEEIQAKTKELEAQLQNLKK